MTETENLKLQKPEYTDPADIEILNANMDIIDKALAESLKKIRLGGI